MQSLPLSTLMRCESTLLGQQLDRLPGQSVMCIDADGLAEVTSPQAIDIHLNLRKDGQLEGAFRATADAWPISDQSLDVVVLRHVFEFDASPKVLLGEALRVVARGGHLLIAGVHPLSPWHWSTLRRMRAMQPDYRARMPWQLESWIRAGGMRVERRMRYGGIMPAERPVQGGGALAACYLLHARRSTSSVTPIRLMHRRRPAPAAVNASLATAAQGRRAG